MACSSVPDAQHFPAIMRRTIEHVGDRLPVEQRRELAAVFRSLCWEFPDYGVKSYFLFDDEAEVTYDDALPGGGAPDASVRMNAKTLHDVATGRTSFALAFVMGRLRVRGIPVRKLSRFTPLVDPFLDCYRDALNAIAGGADIGVEDDESDTRFVSADGADLTLLSGLNITIVGYGRLGRSVALNTRDSGAAGGLTVCDVDEEARQRAADDEMIVGEDVASAVAGADVVWLLVSDDEAPRAWRDSVSSALGSDAAVVFASGFNLTNGQIDPGDRDVMLIAPRMMSAGMRQRGAASFVNVERDASGNAWPRMLALAKACGALDAGAMVVTADQETQLDLFVEQTVGPDVGAAIMTAFRVGVEAGLPPEALVMELYMSGEMSRCFDAMAEQGFFQQVKLHGNIAAFGGAMRSLEIDRDAIARRYGGVLTEIADGTFARNLAEEAANGFPSKRMIHEMIDADNAMARAEARVRAASSKGQAPPAC